MGWASSLLIGLIFSISNTNAQYVIRRDVPQVSQNIQYTNNPVYRNQITPYALPNNMAVTNNLPAYNNEDVKAKLVTAIEKLALANNVLSSLNTILNDYVAPAAKLATAGTVPGMGAPVVNYNTPLRRLRVPIVNEVPVGALLVARNLPVANLAGPIPKVPNNAQVYGKRVNYHSVNTAPNIPLNRLYRSPVNTVPIYDPRRLTNNVVNSPWNIQRIQFDNRVPVNNIRNIPLSNIVPRTNYLQRPITNLPITGANIPRAPIVNFGNVPVGNNIVNPTYTYFQRPSVNLNNIGNVRINDLINIPFDRFANLASNTIARLPRACTRIGDGYGCGQLPMSSSGVNKVIANVPIVPLNSLAELPVYKGLPVIRVSESVYKLTPVNP